MITTIHQLLQICSEKKNGSFNGLLIRTKSGNELSGSLVNWDAKASPALICITGDRNIKSYLDKDSIESISIDNPA